MNFTEMAYSERVLCQQSSLLMSPVASYAKMPIAVNGQQLPTLAPMLEKISPGVVSIQVSGSKEVRRREDQLEYFFGQQQGSLTSL